MLVVHNNEDASGTPNLAARERRRERHLAGRRRDVLYLGTRWVQTGWICDKAPGDFCTDS